MKLHLRDCEHCSRMNLNVKCGLRWNLQSDLEILIVLSTDFVVVLLFLKRKLPIFWVHEGKEKIGGVSNFGKKVSAPTQSHAIHTGK